MADENMTQATNVQQDKKMTVKLKPLALEKATGEQAPAKLNIPVAPAGATASGTVKFNPRAVAASEPEMPTAQDLAKQTIKLAPPPRTGLPKPPPAAAAAPSPRATQVVKEAAPAPVAPNMKKATQIVKPGLAIPKPAVQATATQTVKPVAVAPAPVVQATATQTVKPVAVAPAPVVQATATQTVKPVAVAPAPVAPAAAGATQTIKKPSLSIPKPAPAAPAPAPAPAEPTAAPADETVTLKKPGLAIPKPAPAAPAPAPAPAAPAPAEPTPAAPAASDADAKKVQEEGLKPREGGGSGLGMKKVEQVAEEDLPDALKPAGAIAEPKKADAEKIMLKGPADEPGGFFTAVVILAFILLLIGVYVQFFGYAKWMPEMDAHADKLPAPPTGVFSK